MVTNLTHAGASVGTAWTQTSLPTVPFKNKKVYILPGAFYSDVAYMMAQAGFSKAENVSEADLVVFIGGVDVDPSLYNQERIAQTQEPNEARDIREMDVYDQCIKLRIPMFGICRGAQFLHVMNGGSLWQHVEGHAGKDHLIYDIGEEVTVMATSLHHQMLAINNDIDVVAVCTEQISRKFHASDMVIDLDKEGVNTDAEIEIEAGIYWGSRCFFVQGHPEIGSKEYRSWTFTKLEEFMNDLLEINISIKDSQVA